MRSKKITTIGILACLLCSMAMILMGSGAATTGTSQWRTSNGQEYLYVSASTSYELGYLEGNALYTKITNFETIIVMYGLIDGYTYAQLIAMAEQYIPYIPADQMQELYGMRDGYNDKSCLDLNYGIRDMVLQHVFMELFYGKIQPQSTEGQAGCTDFAAKNTATSGEPLIGQNWDFNTLFKPSMVWVLSELPGQHSVFTFRAGACLSLALGKNDAGVAMTMNLIQNNLVAPYSEPLSSKAIAGLRTADNVQELYNAIYNSATNPYGFMLVLCDEDEMITTQNRPDMSVIDTAEWIVHSNRYTYSDWSSVMIDPTYSIDRQTQGESLMTSAYSDGQLTETELINILNDNIIRRDTTLTESKPMGYFTLTYFGNGAVPRNIFSSTVNWNKVGICPI